MLNDYSHLKCGILLFNYYIIDYTLSMYRSREITAALYDLVQIVVPPRDPNF